jgi:hypothetical protein
MSTGGSAPKAQRAGDRVTKGPLRPQSPEEDSLLLSWNLSPIDGPVDPPEDGRKKSKGHDKIKAKGADIEEGNLHATKKGRWPPEWARLLTWFRPGVLIHQAEMDAGCSSRYYYIIY